MKQAQFLNTAACPIGGKAAGEAFFVAVLEDGATPVDAFWRKRLQDGTIIPAPTAPSEPVASSDEAKTAKKGK